MITLPRRLLASVAVLALMTGQAWSFDTQAQAAFVLDQTTGTVLLSKNADAAMPPASMSKLMTLYIAFEAVRDGRLSLDEELRVSQHAMDYGGSTLFLRAGERVSVEDLLRGIIVLSGNDACVVIAEALSPDGTEAGFSRMMTQRAQQLGMTNSVFKNANGWPADGHVQSARDLSLLATRIIEEFPEFYPMFAEKEFLFDPQEAQNRFNRNPLLGLGIGADGLKTGHTQAAGYGLVGSATQDGRRVTFTVMGLPTAKIRSEESEAIVNWAFRQFAQRTVLEKDTIIAQAGVWMGAEERVGLVAQDDLSMLLPTSPVETLQAEVVYTGPIQAPVAKGQKLAELVIRPEGLEAKHVPLFADRDVAAGGFLNRVGTAGRYILGRIQDRSGDAM